MAEMCTRTIAHNSLIAGRQLCRQHAAQYFAIRTACVIVPLFIAVSLAVLLDKEWIRHRDRRPRRLGPRIRLAAHRTAMLGRRRTTKIEIALPLAVISSPRHHRRAKRHAGVERTIRAARPIPRWPSSWNSCIARRSTRCHALEQLADRVRVPEVHNMVLILTQSNRLGVDMSSALLEFASNFRTTIRQRADTRA